MLCVKANDTWSDVSPREKADILLIDTQKSESDSSRVKKLQRQERGMYSNLACYNG